MRKLPAFLLMALWLSVACGYAQPCPQEVTLTAPVSGTTTAQAAAQLIGANTVTSGSATYRAGQAVQLNAGFEVKPGAVFEANISACQAIEFSSADAEGALSLTASPNPFVTSTVIKYRLARASRVNISITDLRGITLSRIMHDQPREAGAHEFTFASESLPEGLYLCVIDTPYGRKSLRIVKQK